MSNLSGTAVAVALQRLDTVGLAERLVVDASHDNSGKDHVRQAGVVRELAARISGGERGVVGVMMESFLAAGRQDLTLRAADELAYGRSITDASMDWDTTATLLDELAGAVRSRRLGRCDGHEPLAGSAGAVAERP